jgi:hypothetical protein
MIHSRIQGVGRIIAKERELRRRIDAAANGYSEEVVLNQLYNKRYNIFLAAEKMPIHPLMKVWLGMLS